jgi:hypothetical protein
MTPRERVRRAINHESPDRVPLDLGSTSVTGIQLPYTVFRFKNEHWKPWKLF